MKQHTMSDNYRLSNCLYRAALGQFDFRGPARLYFDTRFGSTEHYLLEVHEHNHWQLAHSTIFGLQQLALAYAGLLAKNEDQQTRYRECLYIAIDAARDLFEGCAVYNEKAKVETGELNVHAQWFAILEDTIYQRSLERFERFLSDLPFAWALKASIANNVAELSLNSVPRFLWSPAHLDTVNIRKALSARSPNCIIAELSAFLAEETEQLSTCVHRDAIEPTAREFGLDQDDFSTNTLSEILTNRASGVLSYRTYVAIRDLALKHGLRVFKGDPMAVDLARYDIWLTWGHGLPGHERFYPNMVKDVATFPIGQEPDLTDERYDFNTFQTSFEPPLNDEFNDVDISDWHPIIRALECGGARRQRLYVSLNDSLGAWPLQSVLATSPLVGFVGGEDLHTFESSLHTTMTMEEGKRRFDEEIAQPEPSQIIIRAGRAVFKPRADYVWRHLGARYKFPVPKDDIEAQLSQLSKLPHTLTIRWRNLDLEGVSAFGVPLRNLGCTVGVIVDENSVYGWVQVIKRLAKLDLDSKLHCCVMGSKPDYFFIINIVGGIDKVQWFVFSLASMYVFEHLKSIVVDSDEFESKAKWVCSLSEAGVDNHFCNDILLICEHIIHRGF